MDFDIINKTFDLAITKASLVVDKELDDIYRTLDTSNESEANILLKAAERLKKVKESLRNLSGDQ